MNEKMKVCHVAPDHYMPTKYFTWIVGRMEFERVLAQKWMSTMPNKPHIWVIVPEINEESLK